MGPAAYLRLNSISFLPGKLLSWDAYGVCEPAEGTSPEVAQRALPELPSHLTDAKKRFKGVPLPVAFHKGCSKGGVGMRTVTDHSLRLREATAFGFC